MLYQVKVCNNQMKLIKYPFFLKSWRAAYINKGGIINIYISRVVEFEQMRQSKTSLLCHSHSSMKHFARHKLD